MTHFYTETVEKITSLLAEAERDGVSPEKQRNLSVTTVDHNFE